MVYANENKPDEACAIWHIFSREDTVELRKVARLHENPNAEYVDPLDCDYFYFTPETLENFAKAYKTIPYQIFQYPVGRFSYM
jgi:hypothetical protein